MISTQFCSCHPAHLADDLPPVRGPQVAQRQGSDDGGVGLAARVAAVPCKIRQARHDPIQRSAAAANAGDLVHLMHSLLHQRHSAPPTPAPPAAPRSPPPMSSGTKYDSSTCSLSRASKDSTTTAANMSPAKKTSSQIQRVLTRSTTLSRLRSFQQVGDHRSCRNDGAAAAGLRHPISQPPPVALLMLDRLAPPLLGPNCFRQR